MAETTGKLNIQRSNTKLLLSIAGVAIVVLAAVCGFFVWKYIEATKNPDAANQEITKQIVSKISKIYLVPTDEEPTVAKIQDKEKLKEQSFFSKAVNNDYLVIYSKAKLALLYREKENILVNVGPVSIDDKKEDATEKP